MNARTASILTTATVALLALTGCSDTTRSAEPIPQGTLPASVTGATTANPVIGVTVVNVPTTATNPPATNPPATNPSPTNPTPTNPTPTNPPATQAPDTTLPERDTAPRWIIYRGPVWVTGSQSCFDAVWPFGLRGWAEATDPADPSVGVGRTDFDVSIQPQNNGAVLDDHRRIEGNDGDPMNRLHIQVDHFQDIGDIELPVTPINGDITQTYQLGGVDVIGDCTITLGWSQTATPNV